MEFASHIRESIFDAPLSLSFTAGRDRHWGVMCVNDMFERTTGYPIGDVVGRNLAILQIAGDDDPGLAGLRRDMAQVQNSIRIVRNRMRDGTEFQNLLIIRPFAAGDEASQMLGAQIPWRFREFDPAMLKIDADGRVAHRDRLYIPANYQSFVRSRITLFNSFFRVLRSYLQPAA